MPYTSLLNIGISLNSLDQKGICEMTGTQAVTTRLTVKQINGK